ncbi:glutaminase, partial [Ostertagia ostertagi]
VATYIPQLARADPEAFAISVCTVDGQRKSWGDALKPFCLQSVSKPFTYALVHDEIGPDDLHTYVGQEPSGRLFNDISLDHNKKPHNPLINRCGDRMASLMKRNASLSDRFDFAIHQMRRFCGAGYVGFNNAVFPPDAHLQDTLDLYFQLCSIETNCDTMAVMAATLANGGVNPMNGERVINNRYRF